MTKRFRPKRRSPEEVGYKRPPRASQFKPGQSGNPKGRPKGSLNIANVLAQTLREQVQVNEGGRRRTITKLEAAIKQAVNKAAGGDSAAIRFLIGLTQVVEAQFDAQEVRDELPEDDKKVMAGLLARLQKLPTGESK